jgi:hypothetical protein
MVRLKKRNRRAEIVNPEQNRPARRKRRWDVVLGWNFMYGDGPIMVMDPFGHIPP